MGSEMGARTSYWPARGFFFAVLRVMGSLQRTDRTVTTEKGSENTCDDVTDVDRKVKRRTKQHGKLRAEKFNIGRHAPRQCTHSFEFLKKTQVGKCERNLREGVIYPKLNVWLFNNFNLYTDFVTYNNMKILCIAPRSE